MLVYLLRHGQSEANAQRWFAGRIDSPLTATGRAQAQALVDEIARVGLRDVVSSDLARAADTARLALGPLAETLSIRVSDGLRERHHGEWEGLSKSTLQPAEARALLAWTARPPGGESLVDAALRAATALAELRLRSPTLVVAHNGVLRGLLGAIDGRLDEPCSSEGLGNATLVRRDVCDGWADIRDRLAARRDRDGLRA